MEVYKGWYLIDTACLYVRTPFADVEHVFILERFSLNTWSTFTHVEQVFNLTM